MSINKNQNKLKVVAVIPCFRVKDQIATVLAAVPDFINRIYLVDDACPESTGDYVRKAIHDPRIQIIELDQNQGVGGAVTAGYQRALKDGVDVVVKIDGDGQMDLSYLPDLLRPICNGSADYTKGNRFYQIDYLEGMPKIRLFGNSMLSLINKFCSGYWDIMDPANGFTAIHRDALSLLPLDKLDRRYFFESDMLFRLGTIRAVVKDIPIPALYGWEASNMSIGTVARSFPLKYLVRFYKRLFYNYFLRDFNAGTVNLVAGVLLSGFGFLYGLIKWFVSVNSGVVATTGTVMIAALPFLVGVQLLISAFNFDIGSVPKQPIQRNN